MLTFAMSDAVLYSYNQEISGEVRLSPTRPECHREIEENAPYQRFQQGLRGKEFSDKLKVGVAYASPSFVEHCEVFFCCLDACGVDLLLPAPRLFLESRASATADSFFPCKSVHPTCQSVAPSCCFGENLWVLIPRRTMPGHVAVTTK